MTITVPTLRTERLQLRPLAAADADDVQREAAAREIADTTISVPHPYPVGEAVRFIRQRQSAAKAGEAATFAIVRVADDLLIGVAELRDIDREHALAEISFWLATHAWGGGYMSEVLAPVLRYGFHELQLNRICAYHMVRNPASGRVLEKNGFTREGVLRQRVIKWGKYEDVVVQAQLRGDWLRRSGAAEGG